MRVPFRQLAGWTKRARANIRRPGGVLLCGGKRNIDKTSMSIIEIGPFFSPIAPRADGWDTTIVDFQDGDALREMARGHTAEVIRNKVDEIENVDIVWTGQPLDEAALAVRSDGFDCLIASHVIEHTPDLIRFLQQCSRLLKPDGIISLAVPDMRKCFDLLKSPTSLREILTAYREGRIRHSPEALFEGRCSAATRGGKSAWIKGDHSPLGYAHSLEAAWTEYQGDLKGDMSDSRPYVDNHAWFFTPAMFELAIFELNALKLVNFKIAFHRREYRFGVRGAAAPQRHPCGAFQRRPKRRPHQARSAASRAIRCRSRAGLSRNPAGEDRAGNRQGAGRQRHHPHAGTA
ncbi:MULTISPECIES: methyltransferase domain-containing protein [unclassified Mesorhizobium]|uniref:class I SAM-dependent methyltransferase n=1 Tax=unclassified Mesorhizobium TaxID=325217 RepID=UPI0009FE5230|nr:MULTISPECIES: methyltransferase domain-containing protein [unclassified Mesorhizobium]WJI77226.1 methyltransferase domain-containing protein [Mesorhizobium sp. C395A]